MQGVHTWRTVMRWLLSELMARACLARLCAQCTYAVCVAKARSTSALTVTSSAPRSRSTRACSSAGSLQHRAPHHMSPQQGMLNAVEVSGGAERLPQILQHY